MNSIKFLFDLIHSLGKNEKRFFRLSTNLYNSKKKKHYLILYDLLLKEKIFDKERIQRKINRLFPNAIIIRTKQTMFNQILDSLLLYHREELPFFNVAARLSKIDLLIKKEHYHVAKKMLDKQSQHIAHMEYFDLSISLHKTQTSLDIVLQESNTGIYQSRHASCNTLLNNIEKMKETVEAEKLFAEVAMLIESQYITSTVQTEKISAILNHAKQVLEINQIKTIAARANYLQIITTCYNFFQDNSQHHIDCLKATIALLKQNPHIYSIDNCYLPLGNLAKMYMDKAEHENFHQTIQEMEGLAEIATKVPKEVIIALAYFRVLDYYITFKMPLETQRIQKVMQFIEQMPNLFRETKIELSYNLACYFFLSGNYVKSQDTLQDVVIIDNTMKEKDYNYMSARIMYAICFYEQQMYQLATSEITSFRRKLKRDHNTLDELQSLLKFLHLLINAGSTNSNKVVSCLVKITKLFETNKENVSFQTKLLFVKDWAKRKLVLLKKTQQ